MLRPSAGRVGEPQHREAITMPDFDGTIRQFCEITRQLYPNCRICFDDDDQIVIYTGATLEMGGEVVEWLPEDEDQYQSWRARNPEVCGG